MATSSILERIRVNNPTVIEEYIAAMEAASKAEPKESLRSQAVTDPERLRAVVEKGLRNRSKQQ